MKILCNSTKFSVPVNKELWPRAKKELTTSIYDALPSTINMDYPFDSIEISLDDAYASSGSGFASTHVFIGYKLGTRSGLPITTYDFKMSGENNIVYGFDYSTNSRITLLSGGHITYSEAADAIVSNIIKNIQQQQHEAYKSISNPKPTTKTSDKPSRTIIRDAANTLADFINDYVDSKVSVIDTRKESLDEDEATYKVRLQDNYGNRFYGYIEFIRDGDGEWVDAYDMYDRSDDYMEFVYEYSEKFGIDIID